MAWARSVPAGGRLPVQKDRARARREALVRRDRRRDARHAGGHNPGSLMILHLLRGDVTLVGAAGWYVCAPFVVVAVLTSAPLLS